MKLTVAQTVIRKTNPTTQPIVEASVILFQLIRIKLVSMYSN